MHNHLHSLQAGPPEVCLIEGEVVYFYQVIATVGIRPTVKT